MYMNELWERGASQEEFHHAPFKRPLVPLEEDLDPEAFVPRAEVKMAFGFDQWPRSDKRLIPGIEFSPAEINGLADFVVVEDKSTACFKGPMSHHGGLREIRLRRNKDQDYVFIEMLVALSVETAQEMLVPIVRAGNPVGKRIADSGLALGDVNFAGRNSIGEFKSILFTRHNIYFCVRADRRWGGESVDGVNLLAIAQAFDRKLIAAPLVSLEEFNQLRPRILSFTLTKERVAKIRNNEAAGESALTYQVLSPPGFKYTLFADGTGDLQYDDRTKPTRLSAREPGIQTARLVVIDDHLLFTWADASIFVEE